MGVSTCCWWGSMGGSTACHRLIRRARPRGSKQRVAGQAADCLYFILAPRGRVGRGHHRIPQSPLPHFDGSERPVERLQVEEVREDAKVGQKSLQLLEG